MELTQGQLNALKIAIERYNESKRYTTIVGPAGSGKSTVVKFIIDTLEPTNPVFCAYTGKAAKVLQQKGNKNTRTLHKLLYKTVLQEDGTYLYIPREQLAYNFIIVDECSMVPQDMLELLLSYPAYIIFLGDDAQLPPITGKFNSLFDNPHARLTEIVRQARDNDIINISTKIREGENILAPYNSNEVKVLSKDQLSIGMMKWADVILCATNNTRRMINNTMREQFGFSGTPQVGDKIICEHNDWDKTDTDDNPLVNGTIGYIKRIEKKYAKMFPYIGLPDNKLWYYEIDLETEEGTMFYNLAIDIGMFETGKMSVDPIALYKISKNRKLLKRLPSKLEEFEYAYAITSHKSQGSEWRNVLVLEEGFPYSIKEHRQWLYTSVTRASQKVVIIKEN